MIFSRQFIASSTALALVFSILQPSSAWAVPVIEDKMDIEEPFPTPFTPKSPIVKVSNNNPNSNNHGVPPTLGMSSSDKSEMESSNSAPLKKLKAEKEESEASQQNEQKLPSRKIPSLQELAAKSIKTQLQDKESGFQNSLQLLKNYQNLTIFGEVPDLLRTAYVTILQMMYPKESTMKGYTLLPDEDAIFFDPIFSKYRRLSVRDHFRFWDSTDLTLHWEKSKNEPNFLSSFKRNLEWTRFEITSFEDLKRGYPFASKIAIVVSWDKIEKCVNYLLDEAVHMNSFECVHLTLTYGQSNSNAIKKIVDIPNLHSLKVSGINVKDISPLLQAHKLHTLGLSATQITDEELKILAQFPNLCDLDLSRTKFKNISPLLQAKDLEKLDVSATQITDEELKILAQFPKLRTLKLARSRITNEGIKILAQFPKLGFLDLSATKVTDVSPLMDAKHLETLDLEYTPVTDEGVIALGKSSSLQTLILRQTKVTDEGVIALGKSSSLRSLDLWKTGVTDIGIEALSHSSTLHTFYLGHTAVTDEGVMAIMNSPIIRTLLHSLYLNETKVTDKGVKALAQASNLKVLNLTATNVTDKGVKALAQARNLEVLCLAGTRVENVSYLFHFSNLHSLNLSNTKATCKAVMHLREKPHWTKFYIPFRHDIMNAIERVKQRESNPKKAKQDTAKENTRSAPKIRKRKNR